MIIVVMSVEKGYNGNFFTVELVQSNVSSDVKGIRSDLTTGMTCKL